jgi:hypothetical protein
LISAKAAFEEYLVFSGHEGGLTCKNLSTVDYCLCSVKLLKCVNNFRILDFSSLYSDVHPPLHITFSKKKFIENADYR